MSHESPEGDTAVADDPAIDDPAIDDAVAELDIKEAEDANQAVAAEQDRTGRRGKSGRRHRRKPVKRATILAHRWLSLVLGLVLILITTTGAAVLYSPEMKAWSNPGVYGVTKSSSPITMDAALTIVDRAHPDFKAGSINKFHGIFEVYSSDYEGTPGFYGVDPGSGRITGFADPDHGFMGLMNQIHECFFTCSTYTGYISWLNEPVPALGMSWLSDLTWGGFILGIAGLMLLFLAVSGIWLWWPSIKKFSHGFRVRWRKGRYARDYDLHQVIGLAAIPFLLMWAITGAAFEFNWVNTAWYAATGGETPPEETFASNEIAADAPKPTDIGAGRAIAVGQQAAGAAAALVYISRPDPDDAASAYSLYFARDFDGYRDGPYPGQYGVEVDRYDASHFKATDYGEGVTLSNKILDAWGAPVLHYGFAVNGWWRLLWFGFGLTPLILAATGVSTWLAKRSVRKRRRASEKGAGRAGGRARAARAGVSKLADRRASSRTNQ